MLQQRGAGVHERRVRQLAAEQKDYAANGRQHQQRQHPEERLELAHANVQPIEERARNQPRHCLQTDEQRYRQQVGPPQPRAKRNQTCKVAPCWPGGGDHETSTPSAIDERRSREKCELASAASTSRGPNSAMRPASSTSTLSTRSSVSRRWVTISPVRPVSRRAMAALTSCCVA